MVIDDDDHSVTKMIAVVAKAIETPTIKSLFPILSILSGFGVAGVLVMRRNI